MTEPNADTQPENPPTDPPPASAQPDGDSGAEPEGQNTDAEDEPQF